LCIGKKYCLIVCRQGGIINFAKAFNKRRGTNFLLVLTFQAQPWAIALSWLGPQTEEEPKTVPYLIHKVSRPGCWGPYILLCKVPARVVIHIWQVLKEEEEEKKGPIFWTFQDFP
jgi:hypothetical protein